MTRNERQDSIIAAAVTFAVALLLLLSLFFGGMTFDRALLAQASVPEIQTEDDELFIEPEILQDLGEEYAVAQDAPAPAFKGLPQQAEEENTRLVVPGKNVNPAPPVEKPVTSTKKSPVKAADPPKTSEEKKIVTSKMANKFPGQNGSSSGMSDPLIWPFWSFTASSIFLGTHMRPSLRSDSDIRVSFDCLSPLSLIHI